MANKQEIGSGPDHFSTRPRAVFADDHAVVAEGIAKLLRPAVDLVEVAYSGSGLLSAIEAHAPDIIICDINMPDMTGIEVMRMIRSRGTRTPFVFLSMHAERALVRKALREGANAYVVKTAAGHDLLAAIDVALSGEVYVTPCIGCPTLNAEARGVYDLTNRQADVLRLVARGLSNKAVAESLGISVRTAETHRYVLFQIFDAHSCVDLVRKAEIAGAVLRQA